MMIDKELLIECIHEVDGGFSGGVFTINADMLLEKINSGSLNASGVKMSKAEMFELRDEINLLIETFYYPENKTAPKLTALLDTLNEGLGE